MSISVSGLVGESLDKCKLMLSSGPVSDLGSGEFERDESGDSGSKWSIAWPT